MEKSVKCLFDIICNWHMIGHDSAGTKNGSWSGVLASYDDCGIIGLAIDEGANAPTHALIGAILPDAGISLVKLNIEKHDQTPVYVDAFKNANGDKNTFYGDFSTTSFGGIIPLGKTSVIVNEKPVAELDVKNIIDCFNQMTSNLASMPAITKLVIEDTMNQNATDMAQKIAFIKQATFYDNLPSVFEKNVDGPQKH